MRKIKFRGKSNTGEWVYGSLVYSENIHPAIYFETGKGNIKSLEWVYVDPETVGQFTGLTDKNGKEIYEGDIIEDKNGIGVIMWFQTAWGVASYAHGYNGLKSYTAVDSFYSKETKEWAVIGSIHDNPELLTK
ncbi:YopX family protein [Dysgonomonas mossii]|uniref:YopX protein domain-containing protein n=1 Tax=Dysgonomonas mossii DSM 22836 TaxID=742767 RepID=F8X1D9_9BACT|nr:YopX family protein [Dysgonomonas mossii]EGK03290.1 hypothetical protein HMPREF9456_02048 [Dysgonomonas mossii DSM 22836]